MKKVAFVLVAVVALVTVLSASADPGNGTGPQRDHGHGRWYKRACDAPRGHQTSCNVAVVTNSGGLPLVSASPPAGAMTPSTFATAYNLPSSTSTQTIGIVDAYDDPTAEADLATFSSTFGLPPCTTSNGCFRKVNQTGGTIYPRANSGWALEIALDIETAHGICPSCRILLVEASSNSFADLGTAENKAAALGADVISNSWGAPEFSGETSYDGYFNHPGVAITASTGDSGYGVQYPAASPYVTAVGGTSLNVGGGGVYVSESAWSGAGSGCSAYEPKPAWQKDTGCARRTVADVSADADPNTGAAIYVSSYYGGQGWYQVGGTSLAAPLIGAVYALTGTAGSATAGSAPYASPGLLHDVTSGSNGSCSPSYLCTAVTGFDGPTGLGTPYGIGAFGGSGGGGGGGGTPSGDFGLASSTSPQTVTAGGSASYTVTVTPSGGFTGTVGLSVTAGLPAGATATFTPASLTGGSGSSTLKVSTTSASTGGPYTLTITGTSGTLTHTATVSLTVQAPAASPDFTLAASPLSSTTVTQGGSATYQVNVGSLNGFTSTVGLSVTAGLPAGATASFSPPSITNGSGSSTLTVLTTSSTATGSFTLTISGAGGGLTHTTTVSLTVQAASSGGGNADFTLSVSPSSQRISRSGTSTYTVTVTRSGGFSSPVTLSVSGLAFGMRTSSFSPNPVTGSTSTFTVVASILPLHRSWQLTITGTGGGKTHSTTLSLSTW